jgi:hypothetical protein
MRALPLLPLLPLLTVLAVLLHALDASRVAGNHLSQESDGSIEVAAARLVFVIPLLYHAYAG